MEINYLPYTFNNIEYDNCKLQVLRNDRNMYLALEKPDGSIFELHELQSSSISYPGNEDEGLISEYDIESGDTLISDKSYNPTKPKDRLNILVLLKYDNKVEITKDYELTKLRFYKKQDLVLEPLDRIIVEFGNTIISSPNSKFNRITKFTIPGKEYVIIQILVDIDGKYQMYDESKNILYKRNDKDEFECINNNKILLDRPGYYNIKIKPFYEEGNLII